MTDILLLSIICLVIEFIMCFYRKYVMAIIFPVMILLITILTPINIIIAIIVFPISVIMLLIFYFARLLKK